MYERQIKAYSPEALFAKEFHMSFHMHESSKGFKTAKYIFVLNFSWGRSLVLPTKQRRSWRRKLESVKKSHDNLQSCQFQVQSSIKLFDCSRLQWLLILDFHVSSAVCSDLCWYVRESKHLWIICGLQWNLGWLLSVQVFVFSVSVSVWVGVDVEGGGVWGGGGTNVFASPRNDLEKVFSLIHILFFHHSLRSVFCQSVWWSIHIIQVIRTGA